MQQKTAEVMAEKDTQISEMINFKHALKEKCVADLIVSGTFFC